MHYNDFRLSNNPPEDKDSQTGIPGMAASPGMSGAARVGQTASLKKDIKIHLRETVVTLLIALIILGAMRAVVQSYRVQGRSMEPSFLEGQYLMVNKLIYRLHTPRRGDVIVFWPPKFTDRPYIKRVIALPGERITLRNGAIFIDGVLLDEPSYIPSTVPYRESTLLVPEGQYYVLGDNRGNSSDSRFWGPVPEENIIGTVWFSYWPPGEWGLSPSYAAMPGEA